MGYYEYSLAMEDTKISILTRAGIRAGVQRVEDLVPIAEGLYGLTCDEIYYAVWDRIQKERR